MPKSQNPYFVCAQRLLQDEPLEQPDEHDNAPDEQDDLQEDQHIHGYQVDYMIPANRLPNTVLHMGLLHIYMILQSIQATHSNQNLTLEQKQLICNDLFRQIQHFAPRVFLNIFRLRSQEDENQWPNITWHMDRDRSNINATSDDQRHFFSFSWNVQEGITPAFPMMLIHVRYRGRFQLDVIDNA